MAYMRHMKSYGTMTTRKNSTTRRHPDVEARLPFRPAEFV